MFLVYLLWITMSAGGGYLAYGAALHLASGGFDTALAAMAVLYGGCALYSLVKLVKLVARSASG